MRAMSLRTALSRPWLSSWPVAAWKRRLNSSSFASRSLVSSSSSSSSRSGEESLLVRLLISHLLASDELALHRELVHRTTHRLARNRLGNAGQLEHDSTGLDVGDPPLGRALTGTHAGLGRLLGQRAVGIDVDPHLAAALDVTRHGNTRRLDLPVRDVGALDGLDAEVAEGDLRPPLGIAGAAGVVLLTVFDPPWDQHGQASVPLVDSGAVLVSAGAGVSAGEGVS